MLTPRGKETLPLTVAGMLNKQAAAVLGITEVTLQVHRGRIMRKMEATLFRRLSENGRKARYPRSQRDIIEICNSQRVRGSVN